MADKSYPPFSSTASIPEAPESQKYGSKANPVDKPRRLLLQRTGPAFEPEASLHRELHRDEVAVERRILLEANALLTEYMPHLSAAVRCALRQALEKKS